MGKMVSQNQWHDLLQEEILKFVGTLKDKPVGYSVEHKMIINGSQILRRFEVVEPQRIKVSALFDWTNPRRAPIKSQIL